MPEPATLAAGTELATITDSNGADTPASFTVSLDWGDNTTTTGSVTVTNGTFTVTGPTLWTGGTMDGSGSTIAQGTLNIGLPSDVDDAELLDGRTLTNTGTATWAGGGSISQTD